jgi:hypothetical protein
MDVGIADTIIAHGALMIFLFVDNALHGRLAGDSLTG